MGGIHKLLKVEIAINKRIRNVGGLVSLAFSLEARTLSPDPLLLRALLVSLEIMHS